MAEYRACKVVSSLPGTLVANTLYLVRIGTGFRPYVTNSSGTIVAYPLDPPAWSELTGKPAFGNASLANASALQCGRLTLTSGAAITVGDVTGASTIYFTPWRGNTLSFYDGSDFVPYTFAELSRAISGLTSGKNYDVFAYVSGGSPVFDVVAWTNDTTRATAVVLSGHGIWVNNAACTGVMSGASIAQYRGTLLGTIRTTGTNTTADAYAQRFVANAINPVPKLIYRAEGTAHTYSSATPRGWNNTNQTIEWVQSLAQWPVTLQLTGAIIPPGAGTVGARIAIGSSASNQIVGIDAGFGVNPFQAGTSLPLDPGIGNRIYYVTESGTGSGNASFFVYVIHGQVWV